MFCDTNVTFRKSKLTEKKPLFLENKWIHLKASFKNLVCKVDFVLNAFKNSQKTLLASATDSLLIRALTNICPS